jgi:hypothetical protein
MTISWVKKTQDGSLRRLNDGNADSLIAALVKPIAVFRADSNACSQGAATGKTGQ